ncbi:MAG: DUF3179 domain-containing (seleno)protein [Actinomycetota bacterium]
MTEAITPLPHGTEAKLDKEAYGNYKIAMRFGEAISGWDDPKFVAAPDATHMRGDDYVVGVSYRGLTRAYPLWIVDHYHVVNDIYEGERVMFVSCERCQSGAAFVAAVEGNPGREPLFRSVGFVNATLLLKDLRSGSHWIHYSGAGLDRKAAGVRLPWIPAFHMEWADWVALHPETEVMVAPEDPIHPDARHGHGREEFFGRPGMEPGFISTIVGPVDDTYPENEMVLGLAAGEGGDYVGWSAFPIREVHRHGGVAYEGDTVIFAGPKPDGITMSAFQSDGLTFSRNGKAFHDEETGSTWTIEGIAIDGSRRGDHLTPVPWFYVRWHAWIYFHRDTKLFVSDKPRRRYTAGREDTWARFEPLLNRLAESGREIAIGEPPVSQRRPRESVTSITAYIDGDKVHLHEFASEAAAKDYDAFSGTTSGYPLRPRAIDARTRRVGRIVFESDPEAHERYLDPASIIPLPPSVVPWAKVLTAELPAETGTAASHEAPGFVEVVRALRLSGFEIIDIGFVTASQLRVGCENAIALTIDAERFLLYRFVDDDAAGAYADEAAHALAIGPFVLRSTPETMYLHQGAEIIYAGDEHVLWSPLFDNPKFTKTLQRLADEIRERRTK